MSRRKWNRDWYFWKVTDSFAMDGGIPGKAISVNLPHDAMIGGRPYAESPNGINTGFRDSYVCKYAKKLYVAREEKEKLISLGFDGVYMNALVYVNGQLAGKNMFGYSAFTVDVTPYIYYGEDNLIVVEARGAMKNSRWYSGAGIYRDVYLIKKNRLLIKSDSVRLTTLEAGREAGLVKWEARLSNRCCGMKKARIEYEIRDPSGRTAASDAFIQTLFENEERMLYRKVLIEDPALWCAEDPSLYRFVLKITEVGDCPYDAEAEAADQEETEFGIRAVQADAVRGLRINGNPVKLRGACIHHDSGLLGAATFEMTYERQIRKLKEAGFNAVRSAHHPASPALLRVCDRLGMYIMEETFDMWTHCKSDFDYALSFSEWWETDVELMIRKDYNHPSVIMYSIGNEIPEFGTDDGGALCAEISAFIRRLDSTRLLTSGINGIFLAGDQIGRIAEDVLSGSGIALSGNVNDYLTAIDEHLAEVVSHDVITEKLEKICAPLDVAGYNYMTARYEADHDKYPDRVMVGSETYPPQIAENWYHIKKLPNVCGDFTWTGWEYIGEAGVGIPSYHFGEGGFGARFPAVLAYCGDFDLTGFRRPASYYRELVFGLTDRPYIAVQNPNHYGEKGMHTPWVLSDSTASWTWPGMEGKKIVAEVYSAGDEVELFKNGESLGKCPAGDKKTFYNPNDTGQGKGYRAFFEAVYEPGCLTAVSYEAGREIGRCELRTLEGTTHLSVRAEDMNWRGPDETDETGFLQFISVENCDARGTLDYNTELSLVAKAEGDVEFLVCGNGDPRSLHVPSDPVFQTWQGRAQIILMKKHPDAAVTLTVSNAEDRSILQTIYI